jgi:hypothetical protein
VQRAARIAAAFGFERFVVAGEPFEHLVYVKPANRPVGGFHVYIEGDGTPWLTPYQVALDPTPRQPLMLKLMRLDPAPSLYLGRPCYFGLMKHCESGYWTHGRYSKTVVDSMVAALKGIQSRLGWRGSVTLIGYSGGGALAMLMAPRVKDTSAVVTLAANLDVDAWTKLHGYSPLFDSMNPAVEPPLSSRIRQVHMVGGRDRNVPARITVAGLTHQRNAQIVRFPDYDHHCCWDTVWRSILDRLAVEAESAR